MTWKEKMAEFGGLQATFLTEDGETITFIVVGEPDLVVGKYKKKETKRITCPIITLEGFSIFVLGMRLARRIAKYEDIFDKAAFTVTRNGEKGDQNAQYDFGVCPDPDLTQRLFAFRQDEFKEDEVAPALAEVTEMLEA